MGGIMQGITGGEDLFFCWLNRNSHSDTAGTEIVLNVWRDQERKTIIGGGGGASVVETVKSKLINRISQFIVRDFAIESHSSS